MNKPLPRLFISYSRHDEPFADRLANDLIAAGFEIWLDRTDILPGANWGQSIQEGLDAADLMLLVVTPESMASNNVGLEWQYYFDNAKQIIPLRLRPAKMSFQISRLQYIEFNNVTYEEAFARLLRRLGGRQAPPISVPAEESSSETSALPAEEDLRTPTTPEARPPERKLQRSRLVGAVAVIAVIAFLGLFAALKGGSGASSTTLTVPPSLPPTSVALVNPTQPPTLRASATSTEAPDTPTVAVSASLSPTSPVRINPTLTPTLTRTPVPGKPTRDLSLVFPSNTPTISGFIVPSGTPTIGFIVPSGTPTTAGLVVASSTPRANLGSIAVLLPEANWGDQDRRFLESAFQKANVKYTIANAEGDSGLQKTQAAQAITNGAKVLLLVGLESRSSADIIDTAHKAGVKVIDYDRMTIEGNGADFYVSFDTVAIGRLQGEGLIKAVEAAGLVQPRVVVLNGSASDNYAFQLKSGYDSVIQAKFNSREWVKVDDQSVPGWDDQQAYTIFAQILTRQNGKVDAAIAANDGLASSVIAALEDRGLKPIPLTGMDATVVGLQNILAGKQSMTVYKARKAEAEAAAALAVALLKGEDTSRMVTGKTSNGKQDVPTLLVAPVVVTKDNIAETVIADGFHTWDEICTGDFARYCPATR